MSSRLRRRGLWALAYYPMVALLGIVLLSVHMTETFGVRYWLAIVAMIGLGIGGMWMWNSRSSVDRSGPWLTIFWMFVVGLAYSILHAQARSRADHRMQEWHASTLEVTDPTLAKPNAWQPIAVHATVEESLRFRRSTTPRNPPVTADEGSDDLSSEGTEHWQTLTRVRVRQVRLPSGWSPSGLTASLVIDEKVRGIYPGDALEIYGQWRLPPEPSNPGQYDLRRRYAELGLTAQIKADSSQQLKRVSSASPFRMDRPLAMLTDYALRTIERYVPFDQASLTAALVLGQREQAQWQLQEELLATGTIHMLSISGMHIEMVAVALIVFGLILRMPRSVVLIGTMVICALYAMLCGANPPVARATLMLAAGCIARLMGWQFTSLNILALAGLLILAHRPATAFDVGTQLSFLTVAVLILTFPILSDRQSPLDRLLENRQTRTQYFMQGLKRFAWESLRSSFWVCFLSAPLVWSHFHILSPIAIVLNLVLWLPMLVALLSGLALIVWGWLPPFAALLGMLCGGSLWVMTQLVSVAESIPFGHFWAAAPPGWWLVGFYVIALAVAVWKGTKRTSARRLLGRSLGLWFALGLAYEPASTWWQRSMGSVDDGVLAVTWIDVGHGTCAVIESPDGETWLYDAGRMGDHERSYQPVVNCLWHLGHSRLDRMLLSHADSDHYNAMPGVMERFFPDEIVTTPAVLQDTSPMLVDLFQAADRQGLRTEVWCAGDRHLGRSGWRVEAIHPTPQQAASRRASDNSKSLCVAVQYAGRTILLPGDLEPPGTQQLTAKPAIDVDVMMAPHHGSLSAQAERVMAWSSPETVVMSGSSRSISQRVLETFTPAQGRLLITARDHAIRVEISSDGKLRIFRWNTPNWIDITQQPEVAGTSPAATP